MLGQLKHNGGRGGRSKCTCKPKAQWVGGEGGGVNVNQKQVLVRQNGGITCT